MLQFKARIKTDARIATIKNMRKEKINLSKNSKHKRPAPKNNSTQTNGGAAPLLNQEQTDQAPVSAAAVLDVAEDMVIQYGAIEVSTAEISKKVRDSYLAGNDEQIKSLKIYVKPEDNRAYYVVNEETEGNVELVSQ